MLEPPGHGVAADVRMLCVSDGGRWRCTDMSLANSVPAGLYRGGARRRRPMAACMQRSRPGTSARGAVRALVAQRAEHAAAGPGQVPGAPQPGAMTPGAARAGGGDAAPARGAAGHAAAVLLAQAGLDVGRAAAAAAAGRLALAAAAAAAQPLIPPGVQAQARQEAGERAGVGRAGGCAGGPRARGRGAHQLQLALQRRHARGGGAGRRGGRRGGRLREVRLLADGARDRLTIVTLPQLAVPYPYCSTLPCSILP